MASITKRAVILILCRIMNYSVMVLSPIFLVRIFDMHSYGQYREFILYAMLLSSLILFSIPSNLLYFVSKYPKRESESVTNTVILVLGVSLLGSAAVFLARNLILARVSYDFIVPLILYIVFFINLDILETYWLGKRRTDYVLYYSSTRIVARTAAVILSAYLTRDVTVVIWTLIALEAARCLVVFILIRKALVRRIDGRLLKEQLRFIVPLGFSYGIVVLNNQLANLTISIRMGTERLALYTVGSHQMPIINIIRSSLMDVLFPEMTQAADDAGRLRLWQMANVIVCFFVFPAYVLLFRYAPVVIELLFTSQYLEAVTLFRIYLALMVLQCFEMGTPLRAINQNKYYILGSALTFGANIGIIVALFPAIGFITPGMAIISGEFLALVYLGGVILRLYDTRLPRLFQWAKIAKTISACLACLPLFLLERVFALNPVAEAALVSALYGGVYLWIMRSWNVEEVNILTGRMARLLLRRG